MTDAYAVVKVLASVHRQNRFCILATHVFGEEQARRLFDALSRTALRFLNASLDFLGGVPGEPQLLRAVARSQMVVLETPEAPSAQAFNRIAERLIQRAAAGVRSKVTYSCFYAGYSLPREENNETCAEIELESVPCAKRENARGEKRDRYEVFAVGALRGGKNTSTAAAGS